MKTLSQEKIDQIIELYSKNNSLRETCRKLNISIGSAHKYTSRDKVINRHNITTELHSHDERLIGLYIGLWMGDGTQYYEKNKRGYTIKICSNKKDLLLNAFIRRAIFRLFGKNTALHEVSNTNQTYIKFSSKFIFNFVYNYVSQEFRKKTHTIHLKEKINMYSDDFLEGCLLGLVLSDGYLKHIFSFNVTSNNLADNMIQILENFEFSPSLYIQNREKYRWKDLYMVKLRVEESKRLELFLDTILEKLACTNSFKELKYSGPAEI